MTEDQNAHEIEATPEENAIRVRPDFSRFVAVDLETTGLEPKDSEIIELGAVRFIDGVESESFRMLVRPENGYPERNRRLTGIEPSELACASAVKPALEEFKEFVQGDLLVSHNAPFDLNFLAVHMAKHGIEILTNPALCTLHLSAVINPEADTLQLGTCAKVWNIEVIDQHRAVQDARMAGRLAVRLIDEIKSWQREFTAHLAGYRGKSIDPIFDLLEHIAGISDEQSIESVTGDFRLGDAVISRLRNPSGETPLPLLKSAIKEQKLIADDPEGSGEIRDAFNRGSITLLEDKRPVRRSITNSIRPDDKDFPRFTVAVPEQNILDFIPSPDTGEDGIADSWGAFYLGKRSEYICAGRAFDANGRPSNWLELSPFERVVLARWLGGTITGRPARLNWWLLNNFSGLKGHLNGMSASMLERSASKADVPCFAESAREKARKAGRVIVDHLHLCCFSSADIEEENQLDDADAVVVEEASKLSYAARGCVSRKLELDILRRKLTAIRDELGPDESESRDAITSVIFHIKEIHDTGSGTMRLYHNDRLREGVNPIPIDNECWHNDVFTDLMSSLDAAGDGISRAADKLRTLAARSKIHNALAKFISNIAESIRMFRRIPVGWAASIEGAPARNPKRVTLHIMPIDVRDVIGKVINKAGRGFVAIDRHLRYQGSFVHLYSAWGIEPTAKVAERVLDDASVVLPPLFLPEDISPPSARSGRRYHWEKYMERTANLLRMIADTLGGRTVAAFSAHHELRKVREILDQHPPKDCIVLAQYMDGTRSALLREYAKDPRTLLLGGRNFLDGVDLSAAGFTALVLVKLPFMSPEEPLHKAAMRTLEEQGINGMESYLIPMAVETSNRWIDSLAEGIVIILDPRAVQNEWGDEFVGSLNAGPVSRMSFREMMSMLGEYSGK